MVDKMRVIEKFLTFWLPEKIRLGANFAGQSAYNGSE